MALALEKGRPGTTGAPTERLKAMAAVWKADLRSNVLPFWLANSVLYDTAASTSQHHCHNSFVLAIAPPGTDWGIRGRNACRPWCGAGGFILQLDRECGGFFTCLDRDGSRLHDAKYHWLQGREVWTFSRMHNAVTDASPAERESWYEAALLGAVTHAANNRATRDGFVNDNIRK